MLHVYVASSNQGKIEEIRRAARELGFSDKILVAPFPGLSAIEPCPENAGSFEGNAAQKALHYAAHMPGPSQAPSASTGNGHIVLADDSGLEVEALGGAPGIYSARYAGPNATDAENNRKLIASLLGVPAERRTARFVCVIALAAKGALLAQFRGEAEGRISDAPRGAGGFGYDPLFFSIAAGKTFAELSPEEKLRVSHRGKALRAALEWLSAASLQ